MGYAYEPQRCFNCAPPMLVQPPAYVQRTPSGPAMPVPLKANPDGSAPLPVTAQPGPPAPPEPPLPPGVPYHVCRFAVRRSLASGGKDGAHARDVWRAARRELLDRLSDAYRDDLFPVALRQILSWVEEVESPGVPWDADAWLVITVYVRHEGALRGYRPKESTP